MHKMRNAIMTVALIGTAILTTGCESTQNEKDAQIALLEESNQRYAEELAALRREMDSEDDQVTSLRGQLARCQDDLDSSRMQLAAMPSGAEDDGWQAVPGGAMIALEGNVLFASGKTKLRNTAVSSLDQIASRIQSSFSEKDIFVFGHTDNDPIKKSGWKDNWELSAQRSLSVTRYLNERGISPSRTVACAAGEHRPRVPNTNKSNKASNRRVEIFAIDPVR